mgnify:CR=1 FL=1
MSAALALAALTVATALALLSLHPLAHLALALLLTVLARHRAAFDEVAHGVEARFPAARFGEPLQVDVAPEEARDVRERLRGVGPCGRQLGHICAGESRGHEPVANTPEEFAQFLAKDRVTSARIVKDAGVEPQ